MTFVNRRDAGERLAERLEHLRGGNLVILGLARGGVPVAAVVADRLDAPLDVMIVRKLGAPSHPEFAIGAIGETGQRVLDEHSVRAMGVSPTELSSLENREQRELQRRAEVYRGGRARIDLTGRTAVIVDDGIATGSTATVGCATAHDLGATRVVVAVPVAPKGWAVEGADELVAVETHAPFIAVGLWYIDFRQTTDDEVVALLENAIFPP